MNRLFKSANDNILKRVADLLDEEIDSYIIDVLCGFKEIKGLDSKILRRRIFEENKSEIENDMIRILEDEVKELKEINNKLYRKTRFGLSDKQEEMLKEWETNHECKHRGKSHGAIGGGETFEFVPTSIGNFITVTCSCGAKLDLSQV